MKTLIWKDLREHLALALIALVVSLFVLVPAYQACVAALMETLAGRLHTDRFNPQPLLADNLLNGAAIFCALFASLLGWRQVRSESHRDLRAFLLHRPVTRARIFIGKVVAGLALYALGAGLPFAILVAVARIPGNVAAPFEWSMVQPLLGCFLGGSAGYFGGMLTGLWQGRWWASRGLGLGAVMVVMMGVLALPEFWQVLVVIGLVSGVMGSAAWKAFQGQGDDGTATSLGQAVLAVAFLPGAMIAVMFVAFLGTTLLGRPESQPPRFESYVMARDGTVYLLATSPQEVSLLHVDRTPVIHPETGGPIDMSAMGNFLAHGAYLHIHGRDQVAVRSYRQAARYFQLWRFDHAALWYWRANGEIVGYDFATRRVSARIRPPGADERFLRPQETRAIQRWSQPLTLASSIALYRIDPARRSAESLFTMPAGEIIMAAGEATHGELAHHVVVASQRQIRMLTADGTVVWELPSNAEQHGDHVIHVYALDAPGRYCVWIVPTQRVDPTTAEPMPTQAIWLSEADGLERRVELPPLERQPSVSTRRDQVAMALVPPVVTIPMTAGRRTSLLDGGVASGLVVAGLCVLVGWGIGHRHGLLPRQQAGWAVFHLLFGLPGLLVSLAVQEWPTREPCPGCQRPRAVDRSDCPTCGAGFAPPQRDGTEIFEPIPARPPHPS
jgi:hypothetical protein